MIDIKDFLKADLTNISNLLIKNYKKIGMTDKEFLFYIQLLSFNQSGNTFPDLSIISEIMGITVDESFQILQGLMDKGFLLIDTEMNQQGKTEDRYDLTPIYERVALYMEQQEAKQAVITEETNISDLYQTFEIEFGRPLSPIEFETIQNWLNVDEYEIELIMLALREAVLNQAYSLKYIDRILLSWERKNFKSKDQVQKDQKKRLATIESKSQPVEEEVLPHIPMYNWLNPNQK